MSRIICNERKIVIRSVGDGNVGNMGKTRILETLEKGNIDKGSSRTRRKHGKHGKGKHRKKEPRERERLEATVVAKYSRRKRGKGT